MTLKSVRLQFEGVHIHHDLAVAPAESRRHRGAGHARHLVANRKLAQVPQLRFAQPLPLEGDQAHRQARGVKLHHDRRQRPRRQITQTGHGQVGDAGDIRIRIRARLKIDLDQAHARQGARLHVVNARRQGEHPLKLAR